MKFTKTNNILLALLFSVILLAIIVGSEFWLRFFWCLSMVLFYGIYSQYVTRRFLTMELMFSSFFVANVCAVFFEQWFFGELSMLFMCCGYASLLTYLYNRQGALSVDQSFKPYFIAAFSVMFLLVTIMLYALSSYFENIAILPIFVIYFMLILALVGTAFLHFNSVATLGSLYLLGFAIGIVMADVFRFLDYYYYSSMAMKIGALIAYSGGFFLAYKRLIRATSKKKQQNFYKPASQSYNMLDVSDE